MRSEIRDEREVLLRADRVSVQYGGLIAVSDVTLECRDAEITGIIGPNGAGKSSLMGVFSGAVSPTGGRVYLEGRDVTKRPSYVRARRGLARTFQSTSEFAGLTVFENLMVAGLGRGGSSFWRSAFSRAVARGDTRRAWADAWGVLERFEMSEAADLLGSELSGGQRRLLEVMRCLMQRPKLVLLDEPMVGVASHLVERLIAELRGMAESGIGLVVVEHALEVVGQLCDRVVVMARGRIIADGTYEEVVADRAVQRAYLA